MTTFHSDNGAPCWRCDGTIHRYDSDDQVSLSWCYSCHARDNFQCTTTPLTPADASLAHRRAQRPDLYPARQP